MRGLWIGLGNPLRRDDGAASAALDRVGGSEHWRRMDRMQLTPEIAAELAGFDRVVFIDADAREGGQVLLEPVAEAAAEPLTHHSTPGSIVALARRLFGFTGIAQICRIPAVDFGYGEGLSPHAAVMAEEAARLLSRM